MTPESPQPSSSSAAGPLLVLLAGTAFSGVMLFFLIGQLRFVFLGVPVRARILRDSERTRLSFLDAEGHQRESLIGLLPGEEGLVSIRYLPGDPERVRLEEDIHPAWLWTLMWLVLGLAVTAFGVLLMWGRRPKHTRAWGRGRPSEW